MRLKARRIIRTADGSPSVFAEGFGASYHSTHGALQETQHVFVQAGLAHLSQTRSSVAVLDVGFGTGLNFLCSAAFAKTHGTGLDYIGLEAYPLEAELLGELALDRLAAPAGTQVDWAALAEATRELPWGETAQLSESLRLWKVEALLQDLADVNRYDLVYFDAFAPRNQPELWTPEVFARVYAAMRLGGVFVTYCAQGQVRRDLQAAGFAMERLPGPPGKREMLRGTKGSTALPVGHAG